jgi:hypothetical protein
MTYNITNPESLVDPAGTTTDENAALRASAHQLAARLVRLDLDAETLEMVMAALSTDVCDHVTVAGALDD